jgi:hypothetical protein
MKERRSISLSHSSYDMVAGFSFGAASLPSPEPFSSVAWRGGEGFSG